MDEVSLLLSRLDDLVYKCYCGENVSLGFLNEQEVSVAHNYLKNLNIRHCFFGGYPEAQRSFLYLCEDVAEADDIVALKVTPKGQSQLTHRDFLGSLMGLGITRECVGDILLKDSFAVVFVRQEISDYVLQNLSTVGRASVSVKLFEGDKTELSPKLEEIEVLITSMRVDNFLCSICKCSRQTANEYISKGNMFLNYSEVQKPSKNLSSGDTLSIRGFGKYKIGEILRNTKSGRLVLSVLQYK